ncbi:MAG: aldose 1-epimerase family protein [Christensenellales bacterium]
MIITLNNERLQVQIATLGAELQAITAADGGQYLWDGDPAYWASRATNLFPYVGRLHEKSYLLGGRRYELGIHGFLRYAETRPLEESADRVYLEMTSTPETLASYPFHFRAGVDYRLQGSTLHITYRVVNIGSKTMYFGLGGHPGFPVPLEDGLVFEDYELRFTQPPRQLLVSDNCLMTGESRPLPLEAGRLPLRHDLFDRDAVILDNPGRTVTLCSPKGRRGITLRHPDLPYLGLWHRPRTAAPYLCLEPWLSLPGREGVIEDLALQPGLKHLAPGATYENAWSIEVLG